MTENETEFLKKIRQLVNSRIIRDAQVPYFVKAYVIRTAEMEDIVDKLLASGPNIKNVNK